MPNKVWIEIEKPSSKKEGDQRAALLTNLLKRLGVDYADVWWDPKKQVYCFKISPAGNFIEATDNGHWYNLDYFGRPE